MAREYRGLTQADLAQRMRCQQPKIAKIEAGFSDDVSNETLMLLSAALEFPGTFFCLPEQRIPFGSSAVYYRKKAKLSATDRKFIGALVNILRINIKTLLDSVELDPARRLPSMTLEDHGNSPRNVAQALRSYWRIPDGPIKNVTRLIESSGVIIVPCDFRTRDMDATSVRTNDMPPLIFINMDLPGDRWRFTLCHELAHILLHEVPCESMEDEADEFAAEFLMPEVELKAQLLHMRPLRMRHLAELKSYWLVAMSALIVRAKELGVLDDQSAKTLFVERASLGGNQEFIKIQKEEPRNLANMLLYHRQDMEFNSAELAGLLSVTPRELKSLLGVFDPAPQPQKRTLRLVQ